MRFPSTGAVAAVAVLASALSCSACADGFRPYLAPDAGQCVFAAPGQAACCNAGAGCAGTSSCNRATCSCEDIESPCSAGNPDAGPLPTGGPPDAGPPPVGTVGATGGTVDRLWFATTGDTRPSNCDQTDLYPAASMAEIARSMKALQVQFALDLGDHMFVCNQSFAEATQQMGFYTTAIAGGPATWFMTMGNHECGNYGTGTSGCFDASADANFHAYMTALNRPKPYYSFDVGTGHGLARFVVIADDAWDSAQAAWLAQTLSDADAHAAYTVVARHHPMTGSRTGNAAIVTAIEGHKYALILTAHTHAYSHGADHGGRAAIVGLGGVPSGAAPGFATVLQNADGTLSFTLRDAAGNPQQTPWKVAPQ